MKCLEELGYKYMYANHISDKKISMLDAKSLLVTVKIYHAGDILIVDYF